MSQNLNNVLDCIEAVIESQQRTIEMLQAFLQHQQHAKSTSRAINFHGTKNMRMESNRLRSSGSVRLKEWRRQNNITQIELAKMLGLCSNVSVSRWENARVIPSHSKRKKIQEVTNNFVLGRQWKEIHQWEIHQ